MSFIQVIEFKTSKVDEMLKLGNEWEAAASDGVTARRRVLCEDRDNPGSYFNIVFFDSFEAAMANSELPATQAFSQRMMALGDGSPTFHNLDVVEDVEL